MNKELLLKAIDEKLVSIQKHPDADLFIYNYTPKVQYERLWDDVTLNTRGLILDGDMNIVARPFGKFFNIEEHIEEEIPNLPFEVWEKKDGSLGILYHLDGKPYIATRGSFTSDQAIHATKLLYDRYHHTFDKLDGNKTYLFEIIYPENRIVVNYSTTDDIILLAITNNETGEDLPLEDIGFTMVEKYDGVNDIKRLKSLEVDNKEGYVIKFKNNFRVKVKFAEYVRLHRILTGISNITIWEYLKNGESFDELLERVPDEFYDWVKKTKEFSLSQFEIMDRYIHRAYESVFNDNLSRKEFALKVMEHHPDISGMLFSLWDGKNIDQQIWKSIRPTYSKPFKIEI